MHTQLVVFSGIAMYYGDLYELSIHNYHYNPRIALVQRLTNATSVAPGDVLVLAQEVEPLVAEHSECINYTMRILGATRELQQP